MSSNGKIVDNPDLSWNSLDKVQINFIEMRRQCRRIEELGNLTYKRAIALSKALQSLITSVSSNITLDSFNDAAENIKDYTDDVVKAMTEQTDKYEILNDNIKRELEKMVDDLFVYVGIDSTGIKIYKNIYDADTNEEVNYNELLNKSDKVSGGISTGSSSVTSESFSVVLPSGVDTSTTTYMNWHQNWNEGSNQKKLYDQAFSDNSVYCDEDGFYYVNDGNDVRYVVATTTKYGDVGDYIDVYQENGSILKCVIGDAKSYYDANSGEYGHMYGGTINVLEFMTNWNGSHNNPGIVRESLDQNVIEVVNTGESYNF